MAEFWQANGQWVLRIVMIAFMPWHHGVLGGTRRHGADAEHPDGHRSHRSGGCH